MASSRINIYEDISQVPAVKPGLYNYRKDNNIYTCGKKTYSIKEDLKKIKGTHWDPRTQCWSTPNIQEQELINLLIDHLSEDVRTLTPEDYKLSKAITTSPFLDSIPEVVSIPKRHVGGGQFYKYKDQLYFCGTNTRLFKTKLTSIQAYVDSDTKCWIIPVSKADELFNHIHEQKEIKKERQTVRNESVLQAKYEEEELKNRLAQPEIEDVYTPQQSKYRPGQPTSELARLKNLDAEILSKKWADKIIRLRTDNSLRTTKTAIMTYEGDIKPPDMAFIYALDGWHAWNFGGSVKRIDYKLYEVQVDID